MAVLIAKAKGLLCKSSIYYDSSLIPITHFFCMRGLASPRFQMNLQPDNGTLVTGISFAAHMTKRVFLDGLLASES